MNRYFVFLPLLILVLATSTIAQDYWWETVIDADAGFKDMQIIDIDGDGDNDIIGVYASSLDQDVYLWRNDGTGAFSRESLLPASLDILALTAADVDQDGLIDLVIELGERVSLFHNTGNLQFEEIFLFDDDYLVRTTCVIVDWDFDSDLDIIVSNEGLVSEGTRGSIHWLENNGDVSFTDHILLSDDQFFCVNVYDLNDDGHNDLIVNHHDFDPSEYKFSVFANNGDDTFTAYTLQINLMYSTSASNVEAADLDQDGDLDIVLGAWYLPEGLGWFEATGEFTFEPVWNDENWINSKHPKLVDIDLDGDIDVVQATIPPIMLINDGAADFTMEGFSRLTDTASHEIADMNGDGLLDIVRRNELLQLVCSSPSNEEQPLPDPVLVNSVSNHGLYFKPNSENVSGEFPNGSNKIYFMECGVWVAAKDGPIRRVSVAERYDNDFLPTAVGGGSRPGVTYATLGDGQYSYSCTFDDDVQGGNGPLEVQIEQTVTAYPAGDGPTGAHLVEQTLTNFSDNTLDSVYVAWVFNMNMAGSYGLVRQGSLDDLCEYDSDRQLAFMWDGDDSETAYDDTFEFGWVPGVGGIKILDGPAETAAFQWWPFDEAPDIDADKFAYVSGTYPASGGAFKAPPDSSYCYVMMLSCGPFVLEPGESADLAMTYAMGYYLDGLQQMIDEMTTFYLETPEQLDGSAQPLTFSLGEPYPNPFNASVMIPFQLDQRGHATIAVTDILGRRVATLLDAVRSPGQHRVSFNGEDLASGVYFVTLISDERSTQARKIVFMK